MTITRRRQVEDTYLRQNATHLWDILGRPRTQSSNSHQHHTKNDNLR
jgi:hypothetical protein